jgi:hypothetical protein
MGRSAPIHALLSIDFAHGVRFLRRVLPAGHKSRHSVVELNYQYQYVTTLHRPIAQAGEQPWGVVNLAAIASALGLFDIVFASLKDSEADKRPRRECVRPWICQAPPGRKSPAIMKEHNA